MKSSIYRYETMVGGEPFVLHVPTAGEFEGEPLFNDRVTRYIEFRVAVEMALRESVKTFAELHYVQSILLGHTAREFSDFIGMSEEHYSRSRKAKQPLQKQTERLFYLLIANNVDAVIARGDNIVQSGKSVAVALTDHQTETMREKLAKLFTLDQTRLSFV